MKCYRCTNWPCECPDGITLIHGDCREVMQEMPLSSGMILADPPYGETNLKWDKWPGGWPAKLCAGKRVSLWCFGSMRMLLKHLQDFWPWRFVQEVVWEKHNGSGFNTDRFRRVHELLFHFVPKLTPWECIYKSPRFTNDATPRVVRKKARPAHWHGETGATTYKSIDGGPRMMRSVQRVRSCHGRALHPTEKPLGILQPIIEYSLEPDELLVVPFAGSGAELLAAKSMGRRALGIEIDEEYVRICCARLRQSVLQFGE